MFDKCPGAADIRTPTLELKTCPECGAEIEMFSTDMQRDCPKCGRTVYNDLESCIQWCPYARECVGEETYRRLMEKAKRGQE
ncbi:MAG: hypothetical protein ACOC6A_04965 [Chloroflexota bacterium]